MLKFLTAAGGGNILAIAGPIMVIVFGAGFGLGWDRKAKDVEQAQLEQENKLDDISDEVAVDTTKIADDVSAKITVRNAKQVSINTQAIKDAAILQGRLEGRAEGYQKGFDDAAKIPNTCINDPEFLPDGMRVGASSRYRAIFGSPEPIEQSSEAPILLGYPFDPPYNQQTN